MNIAERSIGRLDPASLPRIREFLLMGILVAVIFVLQWFLIQRIPTGKIGWEYFMLALPMAFGVCFLIWLDERIWVVAAILGHLFFMVAFQKGIGFQELSFSVITHFGMAVWFAKEVALHRRPLIISGFDLLLLSFVVVSTITTFIANRLYGGDLLGYAREWFTTYDLLLYFPLRSVLKTRRDVAIVLVAFGLVGLVAGFNSIFTYRERLLDAVYEYQIAGSRVFANETTAMAFMFMFAVLFAYSRGIFGRLITFGGMGLGAVFLGVSFARGAIVTGIMGLFVLAVILPFKRGRRVIFAFFGSILVIGGFLYLTFPNLVGTFAKSMEMRIGSVLKANKDASFNARTVEYTAIFEKFVVTNPLLGFGYGVQYRYQDALSPYTLFPTYIHNGYVRPIYKFGIPLALLVYLIMVYPLIRLLVRYPSRRDDPYLWGITAGSSSYLIAILVLNYTTEVFSVFWTVLNFAVVWAVMDYVNTELKRREVNLVQPQLQPGETPLPGLTPGVG